MKHKKFFAITIMCGIIGYAAIDLLAMTPNPIISRGKTVYTSSGNATYLTDGIFKGTQFSIAANAWVAINVGTGPSKVIFNWNSSDSAWANTIGPCRHGYSLPTNYTIAKSSNSTNGSDGTWTTVENVTGNTVTCRCHVFDFTGSSWIKMTMTSVSTGVLSKLDEIEVFDASKGIEDSWCFVGTSITQMTFKDKPPTSDKIFPSLVTAAHPKFTPAIVRAGIGCTRIGDVSSNLTSTYLPSARNVHFWAIEMGANDALQNVAVATFTKNLATVVDSCLAIGIVPVIARTPWIKASTANGAGVPDGYLTAIDSLTKVHKLRPGPDFFTYFKANPTEIDSKGVHPNASGIESIQRLWAQSMSPYYDTITTPIIKESSVPNRFVKNISVTMQNGQIKLQSTYPGTACVYTVLGQLVKKVQVTSTASIKIDREGLYLVQFNSAKGVEISQVLRYK